MRSLYELWPIVLILIIARWTGQRYQTINIQVFLLLVVAFAGVAFILLSQGSEGSGTFIEVAGRSWRFWVGFLLALVAAVITALTGFSWVWSNRMVKNAQLPEIVSSRYADWELEMFFLLVALVVTNLVAMVLNQLVGWVFGAFSGEFISWSAFGLAAVGGVLSYGVASVMWRIATSQTAGLGIHAMSYGTPVFSLLFLMLAGQVGSVDWDYLAIGTAAIVVANLLINFEADIRFGFKSLIISLWACGAFVYWRGDDLVWRGSGYYELLGVSATVFTLILAFRVARLVGRTTSEDATMFSLFRSLDVLANRGIVLHGGTRGLGPSGFSFGCCGTQSVLR